MNGWKKIIGGILFIGAGFCASVDGAWAQNKVDAKNPFENNGFIPEGSASIEELENQRDALEAAADSAETEFQKAKLKLVQEMAKAEGLSIANDTWNLLKNNLDKIDKIAEGDIGGLSDEVVEDIKTIWNQQKRVGTNIWSITSGFFKGDENDAQSLLETARKNYPNSPAVIEAANDLVQKGIASERAADAYRTAVDEDALNGDIYYFTTKDGQKIYFVKDGQSYKSVAGVTKGCIPLPAKIAENASCIFCPLFLTIFNAAQTMATNSYEQLALSIANVMLLGFAIYIAFLVLKYVSAFTKQDAPKFTNEIFQQAFKVMVAYILLLNADAVYSYIIGPVLSAGMEFGSALLFNDGSGYMEWCSVEENLQGAVENQASTINSGVFPQYLYVKLSCFIRSVQAEISTAQSIGSTLMCVSRNVAAEPLSVAGVTIINNAIWDFSMFFQGLLIWILAIIISLAFAFYLIDATVRLGIIGALMPFLVACWPFKKTSGYTNKGWTMFLNTFFTYAIMGLVISVNIQLIMQALTGGKGGYAEIQRLIDGNEIAALQEILDIGFAGFLVLLGCCLFGWKLTGQATALAGTFASGGGSPIAPNIGGLAASGAKGVFWAGLGVGKSAADATGVTAKVNQGWDNTKAFVGRMFGFGKYSGKAAQKQSGAVRPAPTAASGNAGAGAGGGNGAGSGDTRATTAQKQKQWSDLLRQEAQETNPMRKAALQKQRMQLENELKNNPEFAYNTQDAINDKMAYEKSARALAALRAEETANQARMQALDQTINTSTDANAVSQAQQQKATLMQRNAQVAAAIQANSQQNQALFEKLSNMAGTEENKARISQVNNQISNYESNRANFNNQDGRTTYENSISLAQHQQRIAQAQQNIANGMNELNRLQQEWQNRRDALTQDENALQQLRNLAAQNSDPAMAATYQQQIQAKESAINQARQEFNNIQTQRDNTQANIERLRQMEQSLHAQTAKIRSDNEFYNRFVKPGSVN